MHDTVCQPLRRFSAWVRQTDDHAASHLLLAEQAERLLPQSDHALAEEQRALAAKLERWRYHHLSHRAGRLVPEDWALLDALDTAANRLAGRAPRPPRRARTAVHDARRDDAATAEARDCLDRRNDLEKIVARAAALTCEHFRPSTRAEQSATTEDPVFSIQRSALSTQHSSPSGRRSPSQAPSPRRWRVLLYAPLYLSNYCVNHCRYCGFRHPNPIPRKHLAQPEALREAGILYDRGFRHILLVAGDFPQRTTTDYFCRILRALAARGIAPAIEIAPQTTEAYAALASAGACGVTLYQETYAEELYAVYHPRGSKVAYDWRLEGLERAAEAGIARLGLGILLGLADPIEDLIPLIRHGRYLAARLPGRALAFSLPRIHDSPADFQVPFPVDDETFVRMYCALRVAFPQAELVLSTRERAELRNRLAGICITQMSAGSCTSPGGYEETEEPRAGQQFSVADHRSPAEVADWLASAGLKPVWEMPNRTRG